MKQINNNIDDSPLPSPIKNYLLFFPDEYKTQLSKKFPVLFFLHGAFERGDNIEIVKRHGPPKLALNKEFPFIIVAPQCPVSGWWAPRNVERLIELVIRKYRIDKQRVYLTGMSMGGFATWQLAVRNPERYAAIVPVCGGGNPITASRLKNMPIWAFHGEKDEVISVNQSVQMVDAVNQGGGNAKLTIYPHLYHDSWTETYNNPKLYEWLLEHKQLAIQKKDRIWPKD